jgi:dynein heavy chain
MCVGATGTGKTTTVNSMIGKMSGVQKEYFLFSAQTQAGYVQEQFDGRLERRSRGVFGPRAGKMVVFVDDLNMPQPEKYGAQPAV